MPIKLMIRLFWAANALVGLLIVLVCMLLFSATNGNALPALPVVPEIVDRPQEVKKNLEYYSEIWSSRINTNAPPARVAPRQPVNFHLQLLKQHIQIQQIISNGYALVKIKTNNRDRLLEELTASNKNNRDKPWQIHAGGHTIVVAKIIIGKGILFRFPMGNKEIWLEHKGAIVSHKKTYKLGDNHWMISAKEGTKILRHADSYIEQIAPQVAYDHLGRAMGIRLRRVSQNSKAASFGLRKDDVVQDINGTSISSLAPVDIQRLIRKHRRDKKIVVKVMRNNRVIYLKFDIRR